MEVDNNDVTIVDIDDNDDYGYVFTVDILYGPTKVCGVVKHRTGRIEDVKEKLVTLGFQVNLRRISDFGMVAFAFEGQVVYACAAKNLPFAGCSFLVGNDTPMSKAVDKLVAERQHAISKQQTRTADQKDILMSIVDDTA